MNDIVNPTTPERQPQLTPAQRKLLASLPRNLHEQPLRGNHKTTASQLYAMGLTETRGMMAHQKTLCATDTGRIALDATFIKAKDSKPIVTPLPEDITKIDPSQLQKHIIDKLHSGFQFDGIRFIGNATETAVLTHKKVANYYRDSTNRIDFNERLNGMVEILVLIDKYLVAPEAVTHD